MKSLAIGVIMYLAFVVLNVLDVVIDGGDVLNTAARIQAACGQLGKTLLVSGTLIDRLGLGPEYRVERLGGVELRGKGEPIELCAVARTA